MTTRVRDILAWKKRDASIPPPYFQYRSSKAFIITTICFASFTDLFIYGVIVPVIPFALLERIGIPEEDVQRWVSVLLVVYAAALIVCPPIAGWLTDHYKSRRVPFVLGLFALAGATVMLCLGSSIGLLVAGRLIQGISASVVATIGLALLADTVGPDQIGQAVGWVSLSMSLAILVAPMLGGLVYARAGYYAVYFMAFALIVFDVILRLLLIERKTAKIWENSDGETQGTTEVPSLPARLHFSTADTPASSNSSSDIASHASSTKHRSLLPPVFSLLSSYRLLSAIWCTFAISLLLTAWDAVLPLRVYKLFGFGSLGAGLVFYHCFFRHSWPPWSASTATLTALVCPSSSAFCSAPRSSLSCFWWITLVLANLCFCAHSLLWLDFRTQWVSQPFWQSLRTPWTRKKREEEKDALGIWVPTHKL